MSIKHTVTFPDGTTATRTSENRSYGFAVAISPETKAERFEWLMRGITRRQQERVRHSAIIEYLENTGELVVSGDFIKRIKAVGLGGETIGYAEQTREDIIEKYLSYIRDDEDVIAKIEAAIVDVEAGPALVGPWRLSGWQSRTDLAAKEQATQARYHVGHKVLILTASQVIKGAK